MAFKYTKEYYKELFARQKAYRKQYVINNKEYYQEYYKKYYLLYMWRGMIRRCTNSTATGYKGYGGRGIKVCSRWMNSFEDFKKDMGERPTPKHSIDRINNDGNYEPGNVKWSTRTEQMNNKRCSKKYRGR